MTAESNNNFIAFAYQPVQLSYHVFQVFVFVTIRYEPLSRAIDCAFAFTVRFTFA